MKERNWCLVKTPSIPISINVSKNGMYSKIAILIYGENDARPIYLGA
jgi:hypothetical protein